VVNYLPQFATLRAIGYRDRFVVGVVLEETLILSLLGFVPGLLLSGALFGLLGVATGLPLRMTIGRAAAVLILTIAMCLLSGVIALRKGIAADPAEVF
jgi:putative ABC transport system permease protein